VKRTRVLYHLLRADFLERVRRYGFLFVLGLAGYLGYAANTGSLSLRLDQYRGVYNTAWVGGLMTLVTTTFLALFGFYLVKNTVERDLDTRVGEIIATTPVTRLEYVAGKALSNFAVLGLMLAILFAAAVLMQALGRESQAFEPAGILLPFVLVAVPALAVVSALAVLFETVPALRGGFGNGVYFFVWLGGLTLSLMAKSSAWDLAGFRVIGDSMRAAASAAHPDYMNGISLSISSEPTPLETFLWNGVAWTPGLVLQRLVWLGVSLGLVGLAAIGFSRFDPARERWRLPLPTRTREPAAEPVAPAATAPITHVTLGPIARRFRYPPLVVSELRVMLKGWPWWWYVVAAGLVVAGLVASRDQIRQVVLPLAWIWPLAVWSGMGVRERKYETTQLVFSTAHFLRRQLPALWAAGVLVAMVAGGGVVLRLAAGGEWGGAASWLAGALFIPTLALALGTWSQSSKLFEVVYVIAWYLGPLQHAKPLDFMGTTPASQFPSFYFAATLVLAAAAVMGRVGWGRVERG
jgi:hypothetical protein